MPEKRIITPIPSSPTTAPSPSNTTPEIEDFEEQDSFQSAEQSSSTLSTHTISNHHRRIMSTIDATSLTQRQYAVAINTSLNKIAVSEKLNEKNFLTWSQSIVRAIRSIGLHPYLKDDEKPSDFSQNEHLATLECLTNWLLNQMDPSIATRVESDLAIPGSADLEIEFSPSKVWSVTRTIHAPSTEAAKYIAQTSLENFKQGFKIGLEEHMISFRQLKDQLILSEGTTASEDLGRRLIHSLHNNHKSLRQHLL